jgi:hypothetical protein
MTINGFFSTDGRDDAVNRHHQDDINNRLAVAMDSLGRAYAEISDMKAGIQNYVTTAKDGYAD